MPDSVTPAQKHHGKDFYTHAAENVFNYLRIKSNFNRFRCSVQMMRILDEIQFSFIQARTKAKWKVFDGNFSLNCVKSTTNIDVFEHEEQYKAVKCAQDVHESVRRFAIFGGKIHQVEESLQIRSLPDVSIWLLFVGFVTGLAIDSLSPQCVYAVCKTWVPHKDPTNCFALEDWLCTKSLVIFFGIRHFAGRISWLNGGLSVHHDPRNCGSSQVESVKAPVSRRINAVKWSLSCSFPRVNDTSIKSKKSFKYQKGWLCSDLGHKRDKAAGNHTEKIQSAFLSRFLWTFHLASLRLLSKCHAKFKEAEGLCICDSDFRWRMTLAKARVEEIQLPNEFLMWCSW